MINTTRTRNNRITENEFLKNFQSSRGTPEVF